METVPILGNFETLGVVGILATMMLFFMRIYFSKASQYEKCLEEKSTKAIEETGKLSEGE